MARVLAKQAATAATAAAATAATAAAAAAAAAAPRAPPLPAGVWTSPLRPARSGIVEPLVQSDLVLWSSATARIGSTRRELPAVSVPDGARLRARLRA